MEIRPEDKLTKARAFAIAMGIVCILQFFLLAIIAGKMEVYDSIIISIDKRLTKYEKALKFDGGIYYEKKYGKK